ncbi:MAG: LTA synthase family protein [Oscillospiraceae bacterium]|nr:LTA synthase family protein [Oscillospiraceae bacterium]
MKKIFRYLLKILPIFLAYFLVECLCAAILRSYDLTALAFGGAWAVLLTAVVVLLPRTAGRITFGATYYFSLLWALAQTGYNSVFGKMMWLTDIFYAGEGADYFGDILGSFPALWWIGGILLLGLGGVLIWRFPEPGKGFRPRIPAMVAAVLSVALLCVLPELVFLKDLDIWGTRSEYAQSSSFRATYETMYDAKKTYNICGVYQLTFRDVWVHMLYPLTPAYQMDLQNRTEEINAFFDQRESAGENEMTGSLAGKNVVLVLMESMDDWMITPEDTPTIYKLQQESINFTNFYTPGYGTARTINSEFCINTGIYLPTNGDYVFDYVTNAFNQSLAFQARSNGYSAEVFHYNDPAFYSRGVFEPAMGYNAYNCYADYESDTDALYDDCLLFDIPELNDLFFREGQTFNTIITRSAHLSYVYNEVLSYYALKQYPEYRGKYGSQEEDCARVKARLVDDMFARLLEELEAKGQLENTVIIAVTDHYTYGYKNMEELLAHSGVEDELLLEKTPFFVWSSDVTPCAVDKTMNTADLVPTVLNLLGIDSPYRYLGQDAFDPNYKGYALFPDGSWICEGVVCKNEGNGKTTILENTNNKELTPEFLSDMSRLTGEFIQVSNLLLQTDYYN